MGDPADDVLLEAAKTDRAAFGILFDRHAPAIYRFAAHRVGRGPAEDVLAETFTRAFAPRHRAYTIERSLRAWLYAIASNLIADELRRHQRSSAAHERLRSLTTAQFAPDAGVTADPELLVINDEEAPADGERRAPSSAANAASIQLFSTPPVRKPGRDGKPFVEAGPPDPVSDVERLLTEGKLRDGGERVRDGRRVRVLTADRTRGAGTQALSTTTIEYVVDAKTFEPIAASSATRMGDAGPTASTSAAFGDYQRIPLTRDSAELLEIHPRRTPTVVEQTIEQIKNPG